MSEDVGANYRTIRALHPDWTHSKAIAMALEEARQAGNTDIKYPSSISKRKKTKKREKIL